MTAAVRLARHRGRADELHGARFDAATSTLVRQFDVAAPAVVLGSTQSPDVVDRAACAAAAIDVVRRRSGGGAVLLQPDDVVWFDVLIPSGAPGWSDDVHSPMRWLGELIASLLRSEGGIADVDVHRGALRSTPWSRTICFDGLGAGEVTVAGAKVLGLSQRRTRQVARLQCLSYVRHDPTSLIALLRCPRPTPEELRPVATLPGTLARRLPALVAAHLPA